MPVAIVCDLKACSPRARWLRLGPGMRRSALALLIGLSPVALAARGAADPASLQGSWSGGGWVSFASGARERARCRAHYSRQSKTVFVLRATCATASGRASQTASLRQVGANSYSGSFYNSEYNITGTIHVVVRGGTQRVRLTSGSGSAAFQLSR